MPVCCCGSNIDDTIIAKRESQLRHLSEKGLVRCPPPRLRAQEEAIPVTLNVYSLIEKNVTLTKIGFGVFHTGIVVCGIEWSYGEVLQSPEASGLFCVHPGQAAGNLYKTIKLGYTTKSPTQIDTILHRLENEWRSSEYHILHHNCNHFSQSFCNLLSTIEKLEIPAWCNRAARAGDRVIPRKLATKVQRMCDEEPPKARDPVRKTNIGELPASVIPRGWYLHPSIAQPPRYVHVFTDDEDATSRNMEGGGGESSSITRVSTHFTTAYENNDLPPPPGFTAVESANFVVEVAPNLPADSFASYGNEERPSYEIVYGSTGSGSTSPAPPSDMLQSPKENADIKGPVPVFSAEDFGPHQASGSVSIAVSLASLQGVSPLGGPLAPPIDTDDNGHPLPMTSTEVEVPTDVATGACEGDGKHEHHHTRHGRRLWSSKKKRRASTDANASRASSRAATKGANPVGSSPTTPASALHTPEPQTSYTASTFSMSRDVSTAHLSQHEVSSLRAVSRGSGLDPSPFPDTRPTLACANATTSAGLPRGSSDEGGEPSLHDDRSHAASHDSGPTSELVAPEDSPPPDVLRRHPLDQTALPDTDGEVEEADVSSDMRAPHVRDSQHTLEDVHNGSAHCGGDEGDSSVFASEAVTPMKLRSPSTSTAAPTPATRERPALPSLSVPASEVLAVSTMLRYEGEGNEVNGDRDVANKGAEEHLPPPLSPTGLGDMSAPTHAAVDADQRLPMGELSAVASPRGDATLQVLPLPSPPTRVKSTSSSQRRSPKPQSLSPTSPSLPSLSETHMLRASAELRASTLGTALGGPPSHRSSLPTTPVDPDVRCNVSLPSSAFHRKDQAAVQETTSVREARSDRQDTSSPHLASPHDDAVLPAALGEHVSSVTTAPPPTAPAPAARLGGPSVPDALVEQDVSLLADDSFPLGTENATPAAHILASTPVPAIPARRSPDQGVSSEKVDRQDDLVAPMPSQGATYFRRSHVPRSAWTETTDATLPTSPDDADMSDKKKKEEEAGETVALKPTPPSKSLHRDPSFSRYGLSSGDFVLGQVRSGALEAEDPLHLPARESSDDATPGADAEGNGLSST